MIVESGILGFGKRNTAQGIWNPNKDWILEVILKMKTRILFSFFFSYVNLIMPAKLQDVCDAILISASLTFRSLGSQFSS